MTAAQTLGQRIRAHRQARQLTQTAAAERAGLRQSHWSELEHDRANPRVATIRRIARALGCRLGALLD